jgi:hypothetical protein
VKSKLSVRSSSFTSRLYEPRGGELRLPGVEYLVTVDAWTTAGHDAPPVLVGQHFQFPHPQETPK